VALNLYLLTRPAGVPRYDENVAHVIAALSPSEARQVASEHTMTESPAVWLDSKTSRCRGIGRYTGPRRKPHIILTADNPG
jgi:hypothetical protein